VWNGKEMNEACFCNPSNLEFGIGVGGADVSILCLSDEWANHDFV